MRLTQVTPWMFGITMLPYGMVSAFGTTIMAVRLRNAGISVEDIGWYTIATGIPVFAQFLYAPLLDFKFRRQQWLFAAALVSACIIISTLFVPLPSKAGIFILLTVLAQFAITIVGGCNAGLMSTLLPISEQTKASGWHSFGNLGGGAVSVGLILVLSKWYSNSTVSIIFGLLILLPASFSLFFPEENNRQQHVLQTWKQSLIDLWKALRSHSGWTGILLCLSPAGTMALTVGGFASIAKDYHASTFIVAFINGALSSIVIAVGALVASRLHHSISRRKMYLLAGLLASLVSGVMAFSPTTPRIYSIGVVCYFCIAGFANGAFYALVMETIQEAGVAVSTYYTLFVSAANFATMYMILINTRYHHRYGARALLASDAILNFAGVIFLGIILHLLFKKRS